MNHTKIIFFDIDGTLIDMNRKRISDRTLETLVRLKQNNIRICLATGRTPVSLPVFPGIGFDAYLTFNGSYCYTAEETVYSCPIPAGDVAAILKNAAAIGRPVSLASKNRIAANGKDADLVEYYSFAGLEVEIADDFDTFSHEEIYQIMLGCRMADHPRLLQNVRHAQITYWWDRAVDIIPADSGKGNGIRKILSHYHIDRSEALAFGDGNNDIEMLEAVGTGVAMGNASDSVKKAADEICGPVADDGIYQYCLSHGLI